MSGRLSDWGWPILIGLYLPLLLHRVSGWLYKIVLSHLDHAIPDELPRTAGEWLDEQLAEHGLAPRVRALVTEQGSSDFYQPRHQLIHLTSRTHFKADPVFWATAAHELGHARFRAGHPVLGALADGALRKGVLVRFGMALVIGNVLYGVPGVTHAGFLLLAAALFLDAVTLIDEIVASTWAFGVLRRAPALTPQHLRVARWNLCAALGTYLAAFLGRALLASQWDQIVALSGDGLRDGAAAPMAGWRYAAVVAASIIGLLHAVVRLWRAAGGARRPTLEIVVAVLWLAALPALILLVWDSRADATWVWCGLLAVLAAVGNLVALLKLPATIVLAALGWLVGRLWLRRGEIHLSDAFLRALAGGKDRMQRDTDLLDAARADSSGWSPWTVLGHVLGLSYLPLLLLLWF